MESDISLFLKEQKNKKLLVIFPHPDDETIFAGGLLCTAKSMGFKTVVCILTQGGAGQMFIHPHGKTIKQVRCSELECAVQELDVDKLIIEDFDDAKLSVQKNQWVPVVADLIKKENPSIVVTYDNTGVTGHPDHICVAEELFHLIKTEFPEVSLLWSTLPKSLRGFFGQPKLISIAPPITHSLPLSFKILWMKKLRAARSYRSQRFGPVFIHPFITLLFMLHKFNKEWYHVVNMRGHYTFKLVKFDI